MDFDIEYNNKNNSKNDSNDLQNILNHNSKCYEFKYMKFANGLFNKTVDATYVIHLKGNGRYENIMKQLNEYHPSNDVYILLNDGYKKCNKTQNIVYPADDLIDAFFQIFKHAHKQNYDNILILEDDFMFNTEIKNEKHITNINNFLIRKKGEDFIYYIGCIPWLLVPTFYDTNTYVNILSSGMHSVIYSRKNREICMKRYVNDTNNIRDWDMLNNLYSKNRYTYYKPLCYQLVEDTDNSNNWGKFNKVYEFFGYMLKTFFKFMNLDKSVEPGYSILYIFSKLLFLILVILFVYFIIKLKNMFFIFKINKYVTTKKK
jgi:hypothetical protein